MISSNMARPVKKLALHIAPWHKKIKTSIWLIQLNAANTQIHQDI